MQRIQQAEIAYREAFADFARKAQSVQALTEQSNVRSNHTNVRSNPTEGALEAALLELERAHVQYNLRRDEWVQYLLPGGSLKPGEADQAHEDCIRSIAAMLWENAGRPEGTEHEDWRKAEEIVRQATAA
jgi:hypothetical protein